MARKHTKNPKRNIYIAIAVTIVIIATAIFIETSGLSRFLKTDSSGGLFPGEGACYTTDFDPQCFKATTQTACTSLDVNYKLFDLNEHCVADPKIIAHVTGKEYDIGEEDEALTLAKKDCLDYVNREITFSPICDANHTFQWVAQPEITKTSPPIDNSYTVWCAAVVTCIPKPPPTVAEMCAALDPLHKLHCSDGECGPVNNDTYRYECPAGKVCDITNIPIGETPGIICGKDAIKNQWATIDAYCPKLYSNPPLNKYGEQSRACREQRLYDYDRRPIGNGDRQLQDSETPTLTTGICPAADLIGKTLSYYHDLDIAKCGNPKKLDNRKACLPYVGSLTVSCRGAAR